MSHDRRYHPEEITLLTRLQTRLNQGPGLLHEVRCKPIAIAFGPGEVQWESGFGPGRDWAVWISGADFGKRSDIIHDAVVRFPAAERPKHVLTAWSDVLIVESRLLHRQAIGQLRDRAQPPHHRRCSLLARTWRLP